MAYTNYSKDPIVLLPTQVDHFANITYILSEVNICANDTSPTGEGKTYSTLKVSELSGLPLFIVVPDEVILNRWLFLQNKYGRIPPFVGICRYLDLIPHKKSNFVDGDIEGVFATAHHFQITTKAGKLVNKIKYSLSDGVKQAIQNGCIIVFDEVHKVKNDAAATTKWAKLIAKYMMELNAIGQLRSRILTLSATPIDKFEQVITYCRTRCLITLKSIQSVDLSTGEFVEGYTQEILQFAGRFVNYQSQLQDILSQYAYYIIKGSNFRYDFSVLGRSPITKGKNRNIRDMIQSIVFDIIIPNITSSTPGMSTGVYRGFFELDYDGTDTNTRLYTKALAALQDLVDDENSSTFGVLNKALGDMEDAVTDAICHIALYRLRHARVKMVCAFVHLHNLKRFMKFMQAHGYDTLELSGNVTDEERIDNIDKFQGEGLYTNLPDHWRVMGMTLKTGSTGISLHHLFGTMHRELLGVAGFSAQDLAQLTGRINRRNQISDPSAYIIFATGTNGESAVRLLENLETKAGVTRRVIADRNEGSLRLLPGEYPRFIQGVGYVDEDHYKFKTVDDSGYTEERFGTLAMIINDPTGIHVIQPLGGMSPAEVAHMIPGNM
jgi:hypothetical protein